MLFLPESIIDQNIRLIDDVEGGKIRAEEAYQQILERDPEDHLTLVTLGQLRMAAGEKAEAEALFWRAIHVQPCSWMPYLSLAVALSKSESLFNGVLELACRKVLLDSEGMEDIQNENSPFHAMVAAIEGEVTEESFESAASWLLEQRATEPPDVTARLRVLRMIHELQELEWLNKAQVDELLAEGESIIPWLVGVLRGWARDVLHEEDSWPVAHAAAILAELGEVSVLPPLLELTGHGPAEVSGSCDWALDRIIEKNPEGAAQVFAETASSLPANARMSIAQRLVQYRHLDSNGDLFEKLFENLDSLDKEDRETAFPMLLTAMVMARGRMGLDSARAMVRRHGSIVSKKTKRLIDQMMEDLSAAGFPPPPAPEPSSWSVYEICGQEVDWDAEAEAEEEDDDLVPEPVRRAFTPGRNDPCWCGSGKKYKKCHLDSDEASSRN